MRLQIRWLGLITLFLSAPSAVFAQGMEVPPVLFTGPLSHPRYEDGGFFVGFDFLYWKTNNILAQQSVAVRGFRALDDSIPGVSQGQFVGSGHDALNTSELQGPTSFQPGWDLQLGWRFSNGIVAVLDWKHLVQAQHNAVASLIPPGFNVGDKDQNTFLFSPVSNFGSDWSGNQNLAVGSPSATFGIWNAADSMSIEFVQRFDIYQLNFRIPMWETQDVRTYGLVGPRIVWIWEQFRWLSVDADQNGNSGPSSEALYTNTTSNRMYGFHVGCGNDWFMGTTPIGAFACTLEGEAGLYADMVRTSASYQRVDRIVSSSRNRRMYSLVPSLEARANLVWYPWEAISVHIGYDFMAFFNTIASPKPIDFNLGSVNPEYDNIFFRMYTGMNIGVSFVF